MTTAWQRLIETGREALRDVRLGWGRLDSPARRVALLGCVLSHAVGMAIVAHGEVALARSPAADPAVMGAAGLMKLPHALALHAIQTLPILAWLLARTMGSAAGRAQLVRLGATGYTLMLGFTLVQMVAGRAPADAIAPALGMGVVGLLLAAGPFVVAGLRTMTGPLRRTSAGEAA